MAPSDLLDRIQGEISARHRELLPMAEECSAMEAAGRALADLSPTTPAVNGRGRAGRPRKSSPPPRPRAQSPAPRRSGGARKPKGANQAAIVTVLREKATPDAPLTAREVADATGLEPSIVHGALGGLAGRGVAKLIKKPSGRKSYALTDAAQVASA